jgi:hypothetical protein
MRPWVVQQQTLTAWQKGGAAAIGQEAEKTNADKAAGENMQQETSQKLFRGQGHLPLLISVGIILPAEGDLVVLERHQAVVSDSHAMSVAGEIPQHMMRAAERRLGIDDPVLTEQGS